MSRLEQHEVGESLAFKFEMSTPEYDLVESIKKQLAPLYLRKGTRVSYMNMLALGMERLQDDTGDIDFSRINIVPVKNSPLNDKTIHMTFNTRADADAYTRFARALESKVARRLSDSTVLLLAVCSLTDQRGQLVANKLPPPFGQSTRRN